MDDQRRLEEWICEQITRRQRYRRAPSRIGDAVSSLMARQGYARLNASAAWADAWKKAAGPKLAADSRTGNVRRGVLDVIVRNSAVLQELAFRQQQLLADLKRLMPEQKITKLRCRVGSLD